MRHVIDLFFYNVHPFYPILHRPTFEKSLASLLHLHDYYFGCTLLAICAIGARYSNDPRVLPGPADAPPEAAEHQAGWLWFKQVRPIRKSLVPVSSVYELQLYVVSVPKDLPQLSILTNLLAIRDLPAKHIYQ